MQVKAQAHDTSSGLLRPRPFCVGRLLVGFVRKPSLPTSMYSTEGLAHCAFHMEKHHPTCLLGPLPTANRTGGKKGGTGKPSPYTAENGRPSASAGTRRNPSPGGARRYSAFGAAGGAAGGAGAVVDVKELDGGSRSRRLHVVVTHVTTCSLPSRPLLAILCRAFNTTISSNSNTVTGHYHRAYN